MDSFILNIALFWAIPVIFNMWFIWKLATSSSNRYFEEIPEYKKIAMVAMPGVNLASTCLFLFVMITVLVESLIHNWNSVSFHSTFQLFPNILWERGSNELLLSFPFYGTFRFYNKE